MSAQVHAAILDEIKTAGYFSISVDSSPDLSHVDQLCVIVRYVSPLDGLPVERFLTFLELENNTGRQIASQVLNYLSEDCKIDFSKCRGQSYDNAANMAGEYNGMQTAILEINPYAIFVPCAGHSLNLVGRSAVDCCLSAVNFFSLVQLLYTYFSDSIYRWNILKKHLKNDKVLKKLSNTRWEARAVATEAITESYSEILDALESISKDDHLKGDAKLEAINILNKMQEFEFVLMLTIWNDILQHFHRTSKKLQSEDINLKVCSDLYETLRDYLHNLRDNFENFEATSRNMLPDVDYKDIRKRRPSRKQRENDGDAEESVQLSAREKFRISVFNKIIEILENQIKRRSIVYKSISERFSFLIETNLSNEEYSSNVKILVQSYPEDLNLDLENELKQFHSYMRLQMKEDESITANFNTFYNIILKDGLKNVFPNVEISLRIFLTLMITNCSGERSFSLLKRLKNPLRTTMRQERLGSLALLSIESDIMRRQNFDDIIKEFINVKCRRRLF